MRAVIQSQTPRSCPLPLTLHITCRIMCLAIFKGLGLHACSTFLVQGKPTRLTKSGSDLMSPVWQLTRATRTGSSGGPGAAALTVTRKGFRVGRVFSVQDF